jgi:predicted metal-dependent hydrolase
MNHSHRFWALVEKAMPDFKNKIHWLKKHGKEADF